MPKVTQHVGAEPGFGPGQSGSVQLNPTPAGPVCVRGFLLRKVTWSDGGWEQDRGLGAGGRGRGPHSHLARRPRGCVRSGPGGSQAAAPAGRPHTGDRWPCRAGPPSCTAAVLAPGGCALAPILPADGEARREEGGAITMSQRLFLEARRWVGGWMEGVRGGASHQCSLQRRGGGQSPHRLAVTPCRSRAPCVPRRPRL